MKKAREREREERESYHYSRHLLSEGVSRDRQQTNDDLGNNFIRNCHARKKAIYAENT